jgi:hypothetical protein
MALPEVQINISDPGLGIVPASAGKTQVKLGVANKGTPATVYSVSSVAQARDQLGSGPMLDAIAQVLSVAGGPVMAVPLTIPADSGGDGTATGAFTLTGTGSGTVTGSRGPEQIVRVKIILGGLPGTMTYQTALGAGSTGYGSTIVSGANPYTARVVGQYFSRLVFANDTYVANDVYTLNLDGTVTRTGTGVATSLDGSVHSPVDTYDLWVQITTAGAVGTSTFRYSLDGGNNWSGSIATVAKYPIPGTGVILAFSGTFVLDDLYKGVSAPAAYTTTELTAGFTALLANSSEWGFVHVVGVPANAAAAATLAGTVGSQLDSAAVAFRYGFGLIECPQTQGDSTIKSAFSAVTAVRVGVSVGDVDLISPLTGRRHRRNNAWAYAARLSATKLSSHPGQVDSSDNGGPLKNVPAIYSVSSPDDMDANRFVVMRSLIGQTGYFIARGRMLASPGSDFSYVQNRRVMDRACTVARSAMLLYLNKAVRMDKVTGYIDERDAIEIESVLRAKLSAALVSDDEVSSIAVSVSRTDNLLSTSTLNVEVSIVPKGYLETIKVTLGFKNPALQAAA